jgi:hypothetical protein
VGLTAALDVVSKRKIPSPRSSNRPASSHFPYWLSYPDSLNVRFKATHFIFAKIPSHSHTIPPFTENIQKATTRGSFLRSKAVGAWSWPLTSIYCRGQECVELYIHSPNTPSWRGA